MNTLSSSSGSPPFRSLAQGYIRGALVFMFAVAQNAPTGLSLHHVLPTIDTGEIIDTCPVPISKGADFSDLIVSVVHSTAGLWVKGLKEWDGTSTGVKQDDSMFPDAECRRAPKTPESMLALEASVSTMLAGDEYKWFAPETSNS